MTKETILIVEDDAIISEDLRFCLTHQGFAVSDVVSTGEKAIQICQENKPDLVMLDIKLKGKMDGIDTAEVIRTRFKLPFVYLTAYTEEGLFERAKLTEPYGYIIKPFDENELKLAIEIALYKSQMEKKLRESEEKYATLVEQSNKGVIITQNEELVFANTTCAKLTGYEQSELTGMNFLSLVAEESLEMIVIMYKFLQREEVSKAPFSCEEISIITKSGAIKFVELYARGIEFEGRVANMITLYDITTRKLEKEKHIATKRRLKKQNKALINLATQQAENKESANSFFRQITETSALTLNVENVCIWLFNKSKNKLCCKSLYERSKNYHSTGMELSVEPYTQVLQAWREKRTIVIHELPANDKSKKVLQALFFSNEIISLLNSPIRIGGYVVGVVCHGHIGVPRTWNADEINFSGSIADIVSLLIKEQERERAQKALKISEERYALALKGSNDGIWDRDLTTGEMFFSPRWKEILGYTDSEIENQLETWENLIHPDERQRVIEEVDDYLYADEPFFETTYRMRHKNGSYRHILARGAKTTGKYQTPIRFAGSHSDITEKKKLEEQLLKAQKLDSIGVLAGGIAHEYNNLLTVILSNISMAKDYVTSDERSCRILDNAVSASNRAKDLTQELLVFSQGHAPILSRVDIEDLLKSAVSTRLNHSEIQYELHLAENLLPVNIDKRQINQVFDSLLTNAKQAITTNRFITITATNLCMEAKNQLALPKGTYIQVSIKDTGSGILPEHIGKIFDPFFTTKETGSGLGLAIAYAIVRNHNGNIDVESESNKGTTFSLYLPAVEQKLNEVPMTADTDFSLAGKRILVLDDEKLIVEALEDMLQTKKCRVDFACEGKSFLDTYARAFFEGNSYDLVIMDLTIPGGMGGEEAMRNLIKINPNVKAIVSSGYSSSPVMSNFQRYGFSAVLVKPYTIKQLFQSIETVFNFPCVSSR